jgi:5-methylcytosine-specific restriction endonuclease McrA
MRQRYYECDPFDPELRRIDEVRLKASKFTHMQSTKDYIFAKYGEKCLACGSEKNIHLDHVVPVRKNGACDDINNLQPLCGRCNSLKALKIIDYRLNGGIS